MLKHLKIIISYLKESISTIKQYIILKALTDDEKTIQILALTKEIQDLKLQMQKQYIQSLKPRLNTSSSGLSLLNITPIGECFILDFNQKH